MALRDQPYFPFYVKDFMTDEKLIVCEAATIGVYIHILCHMHKSTPYGKLRLRDRFATTDKMVLNFANQLSNILPFNLIIVSEALAELVGEGILYVEDNFLCQKRMVKDGDISDKRATSGSVGGKLTKNTGTKRRYTKPGYLYLIVDDDDDTVFKVGISKDPLKRLHGIRRDSERSNLRFFRKWEVENMGEMEYRVLEFFNKIRDGEWIYGQYNPSDLEKSISNILNKSKKEAKEQQNPAYATAIENNVFGEGGAGENLGLLKVGVRFFDGTAYQYLLSDRKATEQFAAVRRAFPEISDQEFEIDYNLTYTVAGFDTSAHAVRAIKTTFEAIHRKKRVNGFEKKSTLEKNREAFNKVDNEKFSDY